MKVAYVTFTEDRFDPDLDREVVLAALRARGAEAQAVIWDDPTVQWQGFDRAVVRSTWDYVPKYRQFRQWLVNVDSLTTLLNPRMLIEANLVKTYLRDLQVHGIPIVPTQWLTDSSDLEFSGDMVIKPVISAGAMDTIRTSDLTIAREHAEKIIASGRIAMAQPYLTEVDGVGEISVICLHGQPRWAIRKIPALTEGGHGGGREAVSLTSELSEFALKTLAAFPGATSSLYARVDLVPTKEQLVLMELELAEPALFVTLGPSDAADQVAEAILR